MPAHRLGPAPVWAVGIDLGAECRARRRVAL